MLIGSSETDLPVLIVLRLPFLAVTVTLKPLHRQTKKGLE
jgi:hypothetical protein